MKLFPLRRHPAGDDARELTALNTAALDPAPRRVPDPSLPVEARGSWEQAAFTNVQITELIKRELNAQTPPWRK